MPLLDNWNALLESKSALPRPVFLSLFFVCNRPHKDCFLEQCTAVCHWLFWAFAEDFLLQRVLQRDLCCAHSRFECDIVQLVRLIDEVARELP